MGWFERLVPVLAVGLTACPPPEAEVPAEVWEPIIDLVDRFPLLDAPAIVAEIDLGTAGARLAFGEGWSVDEVDGSGATMTWGTGDQSTLEVVLPATDTMVLRARCMPIQVADNPPQQVGVTLDGRLLDQFTLTDGWQEHIVAVPADIPREEPITLSFGYAWSARPSEVWGNDDTRPLSVAWDRLLFETRPPNEDDQVAAHERFEIDFGQADTRVVLGHGWHQPEVDAAGLAFAWSDGPRSEVRFDLDEGAPLDLRLRASPITWLDSPPQIVHVWVNGLRVGEVPLEEGWNEVSLGIPATATHAGPNTMQFEYAWTASPAEVLDTPDDRDLAVAWKSVSLGPVALPELKASSRGIHLPYGSRLDYYLELPPESHIVYQVPLDERHVENVLIVDVERTDTGHHRAWNITEMAAPIPITPRGRTTQLYRVVVRAERPEDEPFRRGGLTLVQPAIVVLGQSDR